MGQDGSDGLKDTEAMLYLQGELVSVGKYLYQLTRGMFEPEELRHLVIQDTTQTPTSIAVDGEKLSPTDRQKQYAEHIAQHVGLDSFEQLVFLQHFVFTFDERRHLLFWDQRVLEDALHLAFGVDPTDAKRAGTLRRDVEKAASLARNASWQASEVRKKINDYESLTGAKQGVQISIDDIDIGNEHNTLLEESNRIQNLVYQLENQVRDTDLRIAEFGAKLATLRADYTTLFSRHIQNQSPVSYHPLIVTSITEEKCGLCGAEGQVVKDTIQARSEADLCPLCGTHTSLDGQRDDVLKALQDIDKVIGDMKVKLDEAINTKDRLKLELEGMQLQLRPLQDRLRAFEEQNSQVLSRINAHRLNSDYHASILG